MLEVRHELNINIKNKTTLLQMKPGKLILANNRTQLKHFTSNLKLFFLL